MEDCSFSIKNFNDTSYFKKNYGLFIELSENHSVLMERNSKAYFNFILLKTSFILVFRNNFYLFTHAKTNPFVP